MTGRELIIYILENGLENEQVIDVDGSLIKYLTINEAAVKLGYGPETIKGMIRYGIFTGALNGEYIPEKQVLEYMERK